MEKSEHQFTMLHEVIRYAADNLLAKATRLPGQSSYSCDVMLPGYNKFSTGIVHEKYLNLVKSMGLDTSCLNLSAFDEFEAGSTRQSVRYAWMQFVADIAEEEGITIGLL